MSDNQMPDFIIIGAAKSGTTSLYYYLLQHPQIYLPENKEPFFFSFEGKDLSSYHYEGSMRAASNAITNLSQYQRLFSSAPPAVKKGEASTIYLYEKSTAERIHHHTPGVRLIAILRNPVERAYSHFQNFRRDGLEPLKDFAQAVKHEPTRTQENWFPTYYYIDTGFYARQLTNYLKFFNKSQIKLFLYEDLQQIDGLLSETCSFIGVDPTFHFNTSARFNISGKIRFPWLYKSLKNARALKNLLRKNLSPRIWGAFKNTYDKVIMAGNEPIGLEIKNQLIEVYREDILNLQDLTGRDLSTWLK